MKRTPQHLVRTHVSKHNPGKAPARPIYEALESRVFLSGTVLATVVNGNLHIRGDAATNSIVVDGAGLTAGQVRISGAGDTAINDQADPVVLSGVTGRVNIRLGD